MSCLKRAGSGKETMPKKGKMRKNKNEKTENKHAGLFRSVNMSKDMVGKESVPKKKKKKHGKTMKWDYSVRINFDKSQY